MFLEDRKLFERLIKKYGKVNIINEVKQNKLDKYITNRYPDDPVKSSLYDYVAGYTLQVNDELRKKRRWDNVTKHLDSAFTNKGIIDVYRTVDWEYMKNIYGITIDNIKDKIGTILHNRAYMSTTKIFQSPWGSSWTDGELILHITSKKEYPYIDVNNTLDVNDIDCASQEEYLLPRNTKLKIVSYKLLKGRQYHKKGTYLIELKVV